MKSLALALAAVAVCAASASSQPFTGSVYTAGNQTLPQEMVCRNCSAPDAEIAHTPPLGFNPIAASDAQLDFYGFPPRPDARKIPAAFAAWRSLVTEPTSWVVPHLVSTLTSAAPVQRAHAASSAHYTGSSANWYGIPSNSDLYTGYAVSSSHDPFDNLKTYVYGSVIVPSVQPVGKCTGDWQYLRYRVGFDSAVDEESPQAGIEADAMCKGGKISTYYGAFYDWYPKNSVAISKLTVSPGDVVAVILSVSSSNKVKLYVNDTTTHKSVSVSFKAPKGRSLVGDTAYWIVSRLNSIATGAPLPLVGFSAVTSFYNLAVSNGVVYSSSNAQSGSANCYTLIDSTGNTVAYTSTSPDSGMTYEDANNKSWYMSGTAMVTLAGPP